MCCGIKGKYNLPDFDMPVSGLFHTFCHILFMNIFHRVPCSIFLRPVQPGS